MTAASNHTFPRALALAVAASLVAGAPALGGDASAAAKKEEPAATIVTGAPVSITGQFATGTGTATCRKDQIAVSGGFAATTPVPGAQWIAIHESQRSGARAWKVSGTQMHSATGELRAVVYCQRARAKIKTRSSNVPLGAVNATVTGLARCPKGTKVLSGGFAVPPATASASVLVTRSILGNGIGWVVDATRLAGADAANATAISYCAAISKTKLRSASAAILGSSGAGQSAGTPNCPKKFPLRAGGFATSTPVNGLLGSALVYENRPVGQSWVSSAVPGGPETKSTLLSNGYCR